MQYKGVFYDNNRKNFGSFVQEKSQLERRGWELHSWHLIKNEETAIVALYAKRKEKEIKSFSNV